MTEQNKKVYILRLLTEIVFIGALGYLFLNGKYQLWFIVFAAGAAASVFSSRFFCGWICPMITLFRPVNLLFSRLKIKRFNIDTSRFIFIRYIMLAVFIISMIITRKLEIEVPILSVLIALSIFTVLVFQESFWHNIVCPFGTALSLTAVKAGAAIVIDENLCLSCGICQKACPADSIDTLDSKKRQIRKADCLVCYTCALKCPAGAIAYKQENIFRHSSSD